jgi:hypothetical protein
METTETQYLVQWNCLGHRTDTYTKTDGTIVMRQHVHFNDCGIDESAADALIKQIEDGTAVCENRIIPAPNAKIVKHRIEVASIRTIKGIF